MKFLTCLGIFALSLSAFGQTSSTLDERIENRLDRLNALVAKGSHYPLPLEEKQLLLKSINQSIQLITRDTPPVPQPQPSKLICTKGSNGLFYPTSKIDFKIVGSSAYQAGHSDLNSCNETLPQPYELSSCFKQSNSLYYPVDSATGTIQGSTAYQAGYTTHPECKGSLPAIDAKVACYKQSNSLYYPVELLTFKVIGSPAYQAGHPDQNSCKMTLPRPYATLACYKQSNGLFYPSDALTGTVLGSTSYQAGYTLLNDCLVIIK